MWPTSIILSYEIYISFHNHLDLGQKSHAELDATYEVVLQENTILINFHPLLQDLFHLILTIYY